MWKRLMCPESDPLSLWFKKRVQRHLRGAIQKNCGRSTAIFLLSNNAGSYSRVMPPALTTLDHLSISALM